MRSRLTRYWYAFADVVGGFIEEAAFRASLIWAVARGKSPKPVERRWWNRATETPVLVDVWDWTNDRHIFSILVWPALEVPPQRAHQAQQERAKQRRCGRPTSSPPMSAHASPRKLSRRRG